MRVVYQLSIRELPHEPHELCSAYVLTASESIHRNPSLRKSTFAVTHWALDGCASLFTPFRVNVS